MKINPLQIFPAMDLRAGKIVRLSEGDPNRQTTYSSDPVTIAEKWINAGTTWLHVVNLDGAFGEAQTANLAALQNIINAANAHNVKIQFGGGIRTVEAVEETLSMGVSRAILGTLAVEQPEILPGLVQKWGSERIGISLDARNGLVQTRGWQHTTDLSVFDLADQFGKAGVEWIVYTDTARDGLETGINLDMTVQLKEKSSLKIIASGGVKDDGDVLAAFNKQLDGIIIGRALYENKLDLAAVIREINQRKGN